MNTGAEGCGTVSATCSNATAGTAQSKLIEPGPEAGDHDESSEAEAKNNGCGYEQRTIRAAVRHPAADFGPEKPDVEDEDECGAGPGREFQPRAVREGAHALAVAGEMDQRDDGEGQLKIEDDLAEDDEAVGGGLAGKVNGQDGGRDGEAAGDGAAQPGLHSEAQKTFHDDLAGHGAGESGGLSGAEQGGAEQRAGERGADERREKLVGLLDLGHDDVVLEEHSRGHDEDGGVDEKRAVESESRVEEIIAAGAAVVFFGVAKLARLHERRVEIQVVRHDGCSEDGDGDVEGLRIQTGQQAADDFGEIRAREEDLKCEATGDGGDEHEHKSLDDADAEAGEPKHEQRVGGGDENADHQRNVEEQIQADGGSENLGEIAGDDGELAEYPERVGHGERVFVAAGLGEIAARDDPETRA